MLFKFLSSCRPAAEAVCIISNCGIVFLKGNILKCSLSCKDAKGGKRIKTNTLCISRGSRISFPFQSDGFFFLSPCSSFIGPHLLAVSFSINNSASKALKCFHLSLSDGSSTPKSLCYMCEVTPRFKSKNAACQLKIDCFHSSNDQVFFFLLSSRW